MVAELLSIGEQNAITGKKLASILGCPYREITAAVERERRQGQPICAVCGESKGYYLAADTDELESYCNRLHHRAAELYKTRRALLDILKKYAEMKQADEH